LELTEAHPIVDLHLFKRRNFNFGVVALCLAYSLLYSNLVLIPLWLQQDMGYTATWAGMASAPSGLTTVIATPLLRRVRTDPRIMSTLSFLLFARANFMRARFTPTRRFDVVAASMAVQSLAMGCFFVRLLGILLDGIPADRLPSASGLSNFARITAGGFGASLVAYFWDRREALHQGRLIENATPYAPLFEQMIASMRALGAEPAPSGRNDPSDDRQAVTYPLGARYLMGECMGLDGAHSDDLALSKARPGRTSCRHGVGAPRRPARTPGKATPGSRTTPSSHDRRRASVHHHARMRSW
jgi:hypothetical protein